MRAGLEGRGPVLWVNGDFTTLDDCRISPLDRGFQYGDGLFETMRAEAGRILFLSRHVERLLHSMTSLRLGTAGLPDWGSVLPELLLGNGLDRETAAVKILVTRGLSEGLGLPTTDAPSILVTARPYREPSETTYSEGWRLAVHRDGFSPPLAMHKSLNYLFYLTARQAAQDNGADEAVILDASGCVAETAAGSLLIGAEGKWWVPDSPYQLPGITVEAVCEEMRKTGRNIERKPTRLVDLHRAETIYVLNSLMLVMPVHSVDGRALPRPDSALAAFLRGMLLR